MKRSKHNLSHYNLCTFDMGEMVPVNFTEVLPGDTVQGFSSVFMRLSPQLAPVMHPVETRVHHWYVPYRILDENFPDFITGGPDGADDYVLPTINTTVTKGDPLDYMGIPPATAAPVDVLAYPLMAYNLIYNEWYRDQDLATERALTDESMARIAWGKDYFTSARPWTQKGPQVSIPIGQSAPVSISGNGQPYFDGDQGGGPYRLQANTGVDAFFNPSSPANTNLMSWNDPALTGIADLSSATGVPVNDLRAALAIQRYQENRARYGSRFTEYLRFHGARS